MRKRVAEKIPTKRDFFIYIKQQQCKSEASFLLFFLFFKVMKAHGRHNQCRLVQEGLCIYLCLLSYSLQDLIQVFLASQLARWLLIELLGEVVLYFNWSGNKIMDSNKQGACFSSSSSSFTADLFGTTESAPVSSAGIFASMFPPPSTVYSDTSYIFHPHVLCMVFLLLMLSWPELKFLVQKAVLLLNVTMLFNYGYF